MGTRKEEQQQEAARERASERASERSSSSSKARRGEQGRRARWLWQQQQAQRDQVDPRQRAAVDGGGHHRGRLDAAPALRGPRRRYDLPPNACPVAYVLRSLAERR